MAFKNGQIHASQRYGGTDQRSLSAFHAAIGRSLRQKPRSHHGRRTARLLHPPAKRHRLESRNHAHLLFRRQVLLHARPQEGLASACHCPGASGATAAGCALQRGNQNDFISGATFSQLCLPDDRLFLRPPSPGRSFPGSLRYRRQMKDDPHPSRQGGQGSLCPPARINLRPAPPLLAHAPQSETPLPCRRQGRAGGASLYRSHVHRRRSGRTEKCKTRRRHHLGTTDAIPSPSASHCPHRGPITGPKDVAGLPQ